MDKGPIKPWILTALRMCRHSQEEEMTVVIHLGSSEERQMDLQRDTHTDKAN